VFQWKPLSPEIFGRFTIYFTAALTLVSGFSYYWKNRRLFSDA
jgi:CDP-diacylglycerol--glycerol-3-phosphate 3-phosphatidyltransferase